MNANTADTDFASASAMPSYGVHSVVAKSTFDALIKQIEQAVKLANEIVHKDIRAQAAETMEIVTRSTIDNTNVWLEISHVNHDYAKLYELLDTVVTCASHYLATLQDLPRSAFVTACLVQVPVLAALIERCELHRSEYRELEREMLAIKNEPTGVNMEILRLTALTGLRSMKMGFVNHSTAEATDYHRALRFLMEGPQITMQDLVALDVRSALTEACTSTDKV